MFSEILNSNLITIENGVELKFKNLQRGVEKNTLVYMGRFAEAKGLVDLIHVVNRARRQLPSIKLILIGNDWRGYQSHLARLTSQLGLEKNVCILGHLSDEETQPWIAKAHLFVSASRHEGFGLAVIEAMSGAVVPFVSDIPAFRHLIQQGENGYLVDFREYDRTAQKLRSVLNQDVSCLADMGAKAQATARDYSWDIVGAKFVELYRRLLENRKRGRKDA